MALTEELQAGADVALDTDAIIHFVEEHERYLKVIELLSEAVVAGTYRAQVSAVGLIEFLIRPMRGQMTGLAEQYRVILTRSRKTDLHSTDPQTAERAAQIRAQSGSGTPHALIAAMAQVTGCSHLVTNNAGDFRLKSPGNQRLCLEKGNHR